MAAAAAAAPLLAPYQPNQQDLVNILRGPSASHLLGTDQLGRDILSRLLYAARLDLVIGVAAIITPFVVGAVIGSLAGWFGGWADRVLSVLIDVVMAFPYYVLIIALVFFLGSGVKSIFVAVGAVAWVSYARIVRAGVQEAMVQDYVAAAAGAGLPRRRILARHVLPNVITQPIIYAMSDIVVVIVGTATLSYFGLGVAPPTAEWGVMIADGQTFIATNPILSLAPGLAVVAVGAALALVGDGLADILRPE